MKRNFEREKKELFDKIGKTYNMVLSASYEGNVSSRMVTVILFNEKFYYVYGKWKAGTDRKKS